MLQTIETFFKLLKFKQINNVIMTTTLFAINCSFSINASKPSGLFFYLLRDISELLGEPRYKKLCETLKYFNDISVYQTCASVQGHSILFFYYEPKYCRVDVKKYFKLSALTSLLSSFILLNMLDLNEICMSGIFRGTIQ